MILYRHIIKEHLFPFLYSLLILVFIFVMNYAIQILDQIISRGLDAAVVLEVFVINLGWMIALAIPMAILTATLMAFGRMSADNEILAIKASGLSLQHLLTPVIAASIVMAVLVVFFNNLILPDANHRTANLMSDIARKKPAAFIEPGVLIKDFENYAIYVGDAEGRTGKLKDIKVFSDQPGEDPTTTVADSGRVKQTPGGEYLQLTLYSGETHSISSDNPDQYFVARFDKQTSFIQNVDSRLRRTSSSYRGDREKSAQMMLNDIEEYRKARKNYVVSLNNSLDSLSAGISRLDSLSQVHAPADSLGQTDSITTLAQWAEAVNATSRRKTESLKREKIEIDRIARRVHNQDLQIARYLVEVHKKYAIPVACIVFVLIGAPLGIMARRGGLTVGASYSVLFFILYWAFLIQGENLADRLAINPFTAMWTGNILIGSCGVYLILRMVRETKFIDFSGIFIFLEKVTSKVTGSSRRAGKHVSVGISRLPFRIGSQFVGILPLYVIRTFATFTLGFFAAIVIIFTVVDYVSNSKRFTNIPIGEVVRFYWYYLPWIVQMVFPIVMLLATMFAIGQMAKHSELTAIKAAGRSIRRATIPLLLLGMVLAFGSFYIGERILPTANTKRSTLLEEMNQMRSQQSKGSYRRRDFHRNFYYFGNQNTIYGFEEFRTHPLKTRNVWRETFENNRIVERIQAESAVYEDSTWQFVNGTRRVIQEGGSEEMAFDSLTDNVLRASPEEMVVKIKSPEEMSYWELQDYIDKSRRRGENVDKYQADLFFKIAYPFMNIIVILLGISVTARAGRGGGSLLFGLGLLLVFSYWIISRFGLTLGKNGHISPQLGAWLGNILFLTLGLLLYRKVDR